jgi:hypothetical protein
MRGFYSLFCVPVICLAQAPSPVISFNSTHHDFGRIPPDKKVSCNYEVINKGTGILRIKEIKPSCGCSDVAIGKWVLAPGEQTFIKVEYNPTGTMGAVQRSVEVISDDPVRPVTTLTFKANVIHDIMPSTTILLFDKIIRDGTVASNIRLKSNNEQPVTVTDIKISNASYISCNTIKDGNDVVLEVSLNGRLIPEQVNQGVDVVTVFTESDSVPMLSFNVHWNVEQVIAASPNRVAWAGEAGKEFRAEVSLNHVNGQSFRVLEAKSTSPLIKVVGLTSNSLTEHRFDVVLSPEAKAGMYRELLTLMLDDIKQKELKINVAAVLR